MPKFIVTLRGPRRNLQFLTADTIAFRKVELANPVPGNNIIRLTPAAMEAEGFDVISIAPKDGGDATVALVYTVRRTKPVRVRTVGRVKAGYVMEPGTADPNQVEIEGPSQDLDAVEHVWTEEVDANEAERDIVREAAIQPFVDVAGKRVAFRCATTVRVSVPVHPELVTRRLTLDVRPLALPGAAMAITPQTVEVEVHAEANELAAPDLKSSITLYVEWPGTWERPKDAATTLGPERVQVRCFAPPRVQVRGVGGTALPTVEVRGALSGALGTPR
jgi:hypothetical protein